MRTKEQVKHTPGHTREDCDSCECSVIQFSGDIHYCPMHAAAPELVDLMYDLSQSLDYGALNDGLRKSIDAALAKAGVL